AKYEVSRGTSRRLFLRLVEELRAIGDVTVSCFDFPFPAKKTRLDFLVCLYALRATRISNSP
ncbi:MAG: hypothetical protein ACJ8M4_07460, partial [Chthoniobacterales bacterium]